MRLVRGFIGIYAVMTDRMEQPIGQSMCFFIIVLDTVILWLLTSVLYLYFVKPITNPREVKIRVSFKGDHLFFDVITSAVDLLFIFQL